MTVHTRFCWFGMVAMMLSLSSPARAQSSSDLQAIKQELPKGFQRSEFLVEHGMVDTIVDRRELKLMIARLLRHMLGLPAPEETNGDGNGNGTSAT